MPLTVGAARSFLVVGQDNRHLGRELVVVGEEDPVDSVEEEVEASGVEEDHVALMVGVVQDLVHLVLLVLPLCHQKDCLDRVQYPEVAKQRFDLDLQYLMDVGQLLELRAPDVDFEVLLRIWVTPVSKRRDLSRRDRTLPSMPNVLVPSHTPSHEPSASH